MCLFFVTTRRFCTLPQFNSPVSVFLYEDCFVFSLFFPFSLKFVEGKRGDHDIFLIFVFMSLGKAMVEQMVLRVLELDYCVM